MKRRNLPKKMHSVQGIKLCLSIIFPACLLLSNSAYVKPRGYYSKSFDTVAAEKKVDYLEQIYFSGQNKEGLSNMMAGAIQGLDGKTTTASVARQYDFLSGIKDKAAAAENACDVEEMLAAGIYAIDINEALAQNIPKPSAKINTDVGPALAKLSSAVSSNGTSAAIDIYKLNRGTSTLVAGTKVLGAASTISGSLNTIVSTKKTIDDAKKTLKSWGFFKDKPCKNVPVKNDFQLGQHLLPDTSALAPAKAASAKIIIKNISYSQLSSVSSAIQKINGVSAVKSDDFNNNTATMLVMNSMTLNELIDKIVQSGNGINFNVETLVAKTNTATLSIK